MWREMLRALKYTVMLVGLPSAIASGLWAMLPEAGQKLQPYAESILTNKASEQQLSGFANDDRQVPIAMSANGNVFAATVFKPETNSWYYTGFADAPEGSIAIIPIKGVLMKRDWCGEFGMMSLARVVRDANASPNIIGIMLQAEGPGGQVYGTGTLADAVKNANKPVFAHVEEGMAASATYWSIVNAEKIYLSRGTDAVGSIGVYQTIADYKAGYASRGIKVIDVYSPKSPEKNASWREAFDPENPSTKRLEKELEFIDDTFMDAVTQARGKALNTDALKGDMYYAQNAITMGLADGIMSYESALEELFNRSKGSITIG